MNLYVKLLLLGLLLVFFTTGSLYYFSNRAAKTTLKEQILEDFGQRASLKMASIDRFVQQRKSDIQTASLNPVLRSRTRFSTEELNALLHDLEEINSLYYSYSFFDTNRIRIADSKGLSVGERHSLSRYWEKIDFIHPKDNFIIDFSLSESIGKIVVHCACIVFDYRGKPTGVLVSRVLVDRLYDVFIDKDQIFEKYKARLELIDQNGNYLYSSEKEKWVFGQVFSGLPVNEILNGKSSAELEKEDRLFLLVKDRGYLNYKGKGWVIIYSLPTRSAFLPIHEIQDKLLLVLIGVVIIAILITFLATRLFTRPIEELTKTAKEMANGNLDASFIVRSHDEIQNLGLHLQKMARALKSKLQEQIELSDQLAQKNQSITDSIVFAQRIQNTILPPKPIWDRLFREHFIYYKPKDIVSGDFYYLTEQNNKILFAVADCTGHGVP
jgi:HAMP domain-containing protein